MGRRGPIPKPAADTRGTLVAFRLKPEDAIRLKEAALKKGTTVSDFVREAAMRAVRMQ